MADNIIDEMHKIFTKNQIDKNISIVDDFIAGRRQEYLIEEERTYNTCYNYYRCFIDYKSFHQIGKIYLFQG